MLIKDIEPIDKAGVNLLKHDNPNMLINEIIELPLRKACEIFRKKGIETFMSSANKNNVLKQGEKRIEKEDIYVKSENATIEQMLKPPALFYEAGKGYAWIMLDFDTLSDENKDWLFSLEERKGSNGEKIGEKAVWFAHPSEMGNLEYSIRIGKCDKESLREVLQEEEIPQNVEFDKRLAEFEKRHIVLMGVYSMQTVVLRMPIDEQTTVEEVEEYFLKLAKSFKTQIIDKKFEAPEER